MIIAMYLFKYKKLVNVIEISGGGLHSLARTCDGDVFAWGLNDNGQLGNGTFIDSNVPIRAFLCDENVIAIAAGGKHSLALLKNHTVFAWGDNADGQLGDGNVQDSSVPTKVDCICDVTQICAGERHSLAISCSPSFCKSGCSCTTEENSCECKEHYKKNQ